MFKYLWFMMYVNFTYVIVKLLPCSEAFCLHDFRFITLREYELLHTVFSTTAVFFFLFFFFFFSFLTSRYVIKTRGIAKKVSEFFADPTFLVSSYIIKTGGKEKRVCEFFADPSVSQTCAPQPLDPTSLHLYLWGFLKENVHKQPAHIIRNETKYSWAHSKLQWRNHSPGCIKHKENGQRINCAAWRAFSALNLTSCLSWL